ncbi:UDP-N-acetylmuramoyl-L-alanine--D-glutamate ligase [Clostridium cochlearium]|jgi:UDP-N-acetylmuramoylalanine--D-glutamate ligase|uniref:UDP-N-acetylmuramoylalanine--D-glutamate ligase n=1 Tax=Clostridium cochlearium TaxID=1494 RepID=A0ABY0QK13_CLOCO|nr:UDP-N-acetylmuramoyl-L-alanine--D-glutamate ligase [Clostridium cochlearium]NSJ91275.1 UDP-N-acetylmuramoyl-L-alanine--D-glutamate ligase [Coprococcus sp. MSK.21.13]MBE6065537.1 UDP-N-acetylmuramoyl-L-alanine--D-glutamate ligase [Clostridium cochlearium]MCR1972000.1 UDP-N-acetylmuramoyl-L-alanine--D-glutamate ligase [Clostridium cochlearium]SDL02253.1 UDP-N-acetylmuramoylalanine--D-glutamate ligase [Clostridium cochlearium]SNV89574.1 UDP-N-acetylmuramoyl-L-alanyl-D-glutamate synthetase [Clo
MNKDFNEFKKFIYNKKVAIIGLGISNMPLIEFLSNLGARVTGFDKKNEDELGKDIEKLKEKGVNFELGSNYLDKLSNFDVVFRTPSMRVDHPILTKAKSEGAYITSEMEQFIKYCPAKLFCVTGSDGKTTTTTLIYNMLKAEGYTVWIGGNIGTPLFTEIEKIKKEDMVVLELSSFQLMSIKEPVEVALITNVSPNHLDIHKDMEEYIEAKKNIFKYQRKDDLLVINEDNKVTKSMEKECIGRVLKFSMKEKLKKGAFFYDEYLYINEKKVCNMNEVKLKGMHNIENLLAAFCCVSEDISIDSMGKVAKNFAGVEHRLELVKEIQGVKYFNDSIASSPTRTLAGLKSFDRPVILIAGGYDKNISFDILAKEGISHIKHLILLGDTKYKIEEAFKNIMKDSNQYIPISICNSIEEAVNIAKENAKFGDIVTLSPACASFDMFKNFEERGNKFKSIINNL